MTAQMPTQSFGNGRGRAGDERAHIRHAFASLLTKESAVALYILDQKPLNLALKIGGCDINTTEGVEIERTQERPDLLAFSAVYWTHSETIRAIVIETRIAEIRDQGFRDFRFEPRHFGGWHLTQVNTHSNTSFKQQTFSIAKGPIMLWDDSKRVYLQRVGT